MGTKKSTKGTLHRVTLDHVLGTSDAPPLPTLGHQAAVLIATNCAGASPSGLGKTLSSLGCAGIPFQMCVYGSVTHRGYKIDPKDIPDSPDNLLYDVVKAIENSPLEA
jgi:hypothetical protein